MAILVYNSYNKLTMDTPRIYKINFAGVYPLYIAKAERKGQNKAQVDEVISWLTGYDKKDLATLDMDLETFIAKAPKLNPARKNITGVICGVRVEDIEDATTQEIRYMDKLVDEVAKGKAMEKILRTN